MALDPVTRACAEQLRQLDHIRYIGCLFADARDQSALIALHAFHAELARIRESVSEPMLGEIRLTWWREALEEIVAGRGRQHPVIEALKAPIEAGGIDADALMRMIDARQNDLYEEGPRDRAAVEGYCKQTGGALYRAALSATGADEATCDRAEALGSAASLSGSVVAAGFHAHLRRSHIPEDQLAQIGVARDALFQGEFSPALKDYLSDVGQSAQDAFKAGLQSPWQKRQRRALAPLIAGWAETKAAARSDFDPERPQPALSVAGVIARTLWFVQTGRV